MAKIYTTSAPGAVKIFSTENSESCLEVRPTIFGKLIPGGLKNKIESNDETVGLAIPKESSKVASNNNEKFEIEKIGPEIENHKLFPEKCNVTIATICLLYTSPSPRD